MSGFLERLRRKIEEKEQATHRAEALKQAPFIAQRQREAEKKEQLRRLREQASASLKESSFPELVRSLANLIDGKIDYFPIDALGVGEDSSTLTIGWDRRSSEPKYVRRKSQHGAYVASFTEENAWGIIIESRSDGTIIVHGRQSTALNHNQWYHDANIQERALEHAYRSPRYISFKKPYNPEPSGGPG